MKPDFHNIDEILKRYWPPVSNEEMKSDVERVRRRLELGTARSITPASTQPFRWRIATVAAASVFLLSVMGILVWRHSETFAIVESEDGSLFRVAEGKVASLRSRERIQPGETVRTSNISGAQFTLADGSHVEMRATSELLLEHADDGAVIRLNTGGVIVNAAKQRRGHLYVQTKDVLVSVIGTVFYVNEESEGSRVGVIAGEVQVQRGATNDKLLPGQQMQTNPLMSPVSLKQAVSWSRHAESHVALLAQAAVAPVPAPLRLEFEEVSVRPASPPTPVPGKQVDAGGSRHIIWQCPLRSLFQMQADPGRFMVSNATLYTLVAFAYGKDCSSARATGSISGGPGWIRTELFDVQATIPDGAFTSTPLIHDSKLQAMLQAMLKKHFQLEMHIDTKSMPAYDLVLVDKGKLKVSGALGAGVCTLGGPAWITQSIQMSAVANFLSGWFERPVIDKTGVEELIDVCIPLELNYGTPPGPPIQLPTLLRTLQEQMGLQMQSTVASVEVLVIERADRPEN